MRFPPEDRWAPMGSLPLLLECIRWSRYLHRRCWCHRRIHRIRVFRCHSNLEWGCSRIQRPHCTPLKSRSSLRRTRCHLAYRHTLHRYRYPGCSQCHHHRRPREPRCILRPGHTQGWCRRPRRLHRGCCLLCRRIRLLRKRPGFSQCHHHRSRVFPRCNCPPHRFPLHCSCPRRRT